MLVPIQSKASGLDCANSIFVGIHELISVSPRFCPHPLTTYVEAVSSQKLPDYLLGNQVAWNSNSGITCAGRSSLDTKALETPPGREREFRVGLVDVLYAVAELRRRTSVGDGCKCRIDEL